MKSRMDKYNTSQTLNSSRTKKNQSLYDEVRNSSMAAFDINSNISVIEENADKIDISKVRNLLDKKYNDDIPKRKSIQLYTEEEIKYDDNMVDTKEYDINAILTKAKQGKNVDYNKERLKKVHETQYEILTNLDLELKRVDEPSKSKENSDAEKNLINLINTITELEMKNKTSNYTKEASDALDLLSDLKESDEEDEIEPVESKKETIDKTSHIERTLSKLNIDMSSYDDFSDISKSDRGILFIKIIIFFIIIALVIGAIYILDNVLSLGLF